ncbi:MAG TPA: hypothetical protein VEV42_12695 [Pyrinomonadaceae bacterium]|nr:hypothetical protein [Pyrinomonadaceae bacterium]
MTSPVREEIQRFNRRVAVYGKTILIGVSLTAIFFGFYAGLRANYLTVQIITVLISTLSVASVCLLFYVGLRMRRESSRIKSADMKFNSGPVIDSNKPVPQDSEFNEALIRQLLLDVQELTPPQREAIPNRRSIFSLEYGLFRFTFLLSYRIAHAFYMGLQLLRFDLSPAKSEKKI